MSNFRYHPLIKPKYGNLASSLSSSFKFPPLFEYQKIDGLVYDSGPFYPDMVKNFYANFTFDPGCVFQSKVRDSVIGLSLEEFGNCLGVAFEGEGIVNGFTPDSLAWKDYNKLGYYFSICQIF
ncbi:hypothetical protein RYX36_004333 [Vicia faba]